MSFSRSQPSLLAASARAIASVPVEAWRAIEVTCAAAWALSGELWLDFLALLRGRAKSTGRRAAGTKIGRAASKLRREWFSVTAQLPEVGPLSAVLVCLWSFVCASVVWGCVGGKVGGQHVCCGIQIIGVWPPLACCGPD